MEIKRFINNSELSDTKSTSKIYLAGGWGKFRDRVINDTHAEWLNPETMTNRENWFESETNAIFECDGVIAWFEMGNPSPSGFGMTYEMGMAFALKKPYLLICEDPEMLKYKFSMQSKGSERTFSSWEDALNYINTNNWMGIKK